MGFSSVLVFGKLQMFLQGPGPKSKNRRGYSECSRGFICPKEQLLKQGIWVPQALEAHVNNITFQPASLPHKIHYVSVKKEGTCQENRDDAVGLWGETACPRALVWTAGASGRRG